MMDNYFDFKGKALVVMLSDPPYEYVFVEPDDFRVLPEIKFVVITDQGGDECWYPLKRIEEMFTRDVTEVDKLNLQTNNDKDSQNVR